MFDTKITEMQILYDACIQSANNFIAQNRAELAFKALLHAEVTKIKLLYLIVERG